MGADKVALALFTSATRNDIMELAPYSDIYILGGITREYWWQAIYQRHLGHFNSNNCRPACAIYGELFIITIAREEELEERGVGSHGN